VKLLLEGGSQFPSTETYFFGDYKNYSSDKLQIVLPVHISGLFLMIVADLFLLFIEEEAFEDKSGRIMYLPTVSASFCPGPHRAMNIGSSDLILI